MKPTTARRATTIVSAALVLPLLALLTFALLEFGWMFKKSQQVHNSARHGARVGARVDASSADIQAAIDTIMNEAGISGYSVNIVPAEVAGQPTGQILSVTVTVPYKDSDLELIGAPFIPLPANLTAVVSMSKEGT